MAYVNGRPVPASAFYQQLIEAAGGVTLREWTLDVMIERGLDRDGLTLGVDDFAKERRYFMQTILPDGDVDTPEGADQAERVLEKVLVRRGLTAARFEAMLKRYAGLRKLVEGQIEVTDAAVAQAYAFEFGEKSEARIIVVDSLAMARRIRDQATGDASFIDLALQHSTDPSRTQGGYIGELSAADPTLPATIRKALVSLDAGDISAPLPIEGGFAILSIDKKKQAEDVVIDDVKDRLVDQVRRALERQQMQTLAASLLDDARLDILDPALRRSWEAQQAGLQTLTP